VPNRSDLTRLPEAEGEDGTDEGVGERDECQADPLFAIRFGHDRFLPLLLLVFL
jgi:hypothetical protein